MIFLFLFMVLLLFCFTHVTVIPRDKLISEADSRSSNLFAMCSDISIVLKIAKIEFEKARAELSKLTLCTSRNFFSIRNTTADDITDMFAESSIYRSVYGYVTINRESSKNFRSVRYYILRKNANVYIRSILKHFQLFESAEHNLSFNLTPHQMFQIGESARMNISVSSNGDRTLNSSFSFTFVRNPIARFISGYTEVEYRWQTDPRKAKFKSSSTSPLPIKAPLGSIERVKEFILMLLCSYGSRNAAVFNSSETFEQSELGHIIPMIGTLIWARTNSVGRSQKLYKLERFTHEWQRLAQESTFYSLFQAMHSTPVRNHESSKDLFNTTGAAKDLLRNYNRKDEEDAKKSMFDSYLSVTRSFLISFIEWISPSQNIVSVDKPGIMDENDLYVRILCRIYFADFVCAGYKFPVACRDIKQELHELIVQ